MKKLTYIILGFIIGAVLTYYFCPRPDNLNAMDSKVKIPKDTISVAEAKQFSKNWEERNPIEIDSTIEVEGARKVTRSVKWPLEEINDYLIYAKAKSDTLGYNMTGVRVYLGNYGENAEPSKKNRNTMFIVPTGKKKKSEASMNPLNFQGDDEDILVPPLNNGSGGPNGYPN
ncbi:hypothetical protein L3X39_09325 [Sabulilitoribacter multivorans]|uniref:Lipoprotein n=1 Tax=Flaviramulus multivorans TaxID=1304750 RepID=A0ABS9IJS3_9FLAO|nr:hypothetical protein [Flaviramulus multivorans]MCF7560838.1 hypothetical protein [Flaviramulus multivorans]